MTAFRLWVITLFPEYFRPLFETGVVGQALRGERGPQFQVHLLNLRDYSFQKYKGVDDTPFGGGAGMIMRADVLENALLKGVVEQGGYGEDFRQKLQIICPGLRGTVWNHTLARQMAQEFWSENAAQDLVFICGRYEGMDERFCEKYVDRYYSLGDFILSGGELAVLAMIDSAMRFVPGCLGNALSAETESFEKNLLEHPLYTKPREFAGLAVPEVLLSGHHKKIVEYQKAEALRLTKLYRPDLLNEVER